MFPTSSILGTIVQHQMVYTFLRWMDCYLFLSPFPPNNSISTLSIQAPHTCVGVQQKMNAFKFNSNLNLLKSETDSCLYGHSAKCTLKLWHLGFCQSTQLIATRDLSLVIYPKSSPTRT